MAVLTLKNETDLIIDGGTFDGIRLDTCTRCTVRNVTVRAPVATDINSQAVRVYNSPGTLLHGLKVSAEPHDPIWGEGIHVIGSPDSAIVNCDVAAFHQGITFGKSPRLRIEGNTVTGTRTSPIAGGAADGLQIIGNALNGSYPLNWGQTPEGDHADFCHIWTEGAHVTGVKVLANKCNQLDGVAILGIFMQNKAGDFLDCEIIGNSVTLGQPGAYRLYGISGKLWDNEAISLDPMAKPATVTVHTVSGPLSVKGNVPPDVIDPRMPADQQALITVEPDVVQPPDPPTAPATDWIAIEAQLAAIDAAVFAIRAMRP